MAQDNLEIIVSLKTEQAKRDQAEFLQEIKRTTEAVQKDAETASTGGLRGKIIAGAANLAGEAGRGFITGEGIAFPAAKVGVNAIARGIELGGNALLPGSGTIAANLFKSTANAALEQNEQVLRAAAGEANAILSPLGRATGQAPSEELIKGIVDQFVRQNQGQALTERAIKQQAINGQQAFMNGLTLGSGMLK